MISDKYLVYLRTVLIKAGPAAQYNVSNMFTVEFIVRPSKANLWRLKSISLNRNKKIKDLKTALTKI